MKNLSAYFNKDLVFFLDAATRDEAIQAMIDGIEKAAPLQDKEGFHKAILEREKIVSTAIGMGIAIPHARLKWQDNFFIAIGRLSKGIDWKAIDDAPVRLIFLIGGNDAKQTEYLKLLSSLTRFVKTEEIRKKLLTLNSKDAIIDLFK